MSDVPKKKILLASDGSDSAALAAQAAVDISIMTGSELHVVYVEPSLLGRDPSMTVAVAPLSRDALAEIYEIALQDALETLHGGVKQVEEARGTVAKAHLRVGRPADEIVALARELRASLVIVGSRGLTGIKRLVMGSVSERVLRRLGSRVLVVT